MIGRRTAVVAAMCTLLATLAAPSSGTTADDFPVVTQLTRVSGESPFDDCGNPYGTATIDSEVEVYLAVNPADPDHLLASWQQDRHTVNMARSNVVAVSRDRGRTWTRPLTLPGISVCTDEGSPYDRTTDPWGAIGPDGTAYLTTLAADDDAEASDVDDVQYVSVSPDGGATWREPAVVESGEDFFLEKPIVTADPVRAGHAYASWIVEVEDDTTGERVDGLMRFARTTDGGASWSDPVTVHAADAPERWEWPYELFTIERGNGGTKLVILYESQDYAYRCCVNGYADLFSVSSDDAGETWSEPTPIATRFSTGPRGDAPAGVYAAAFSGAVARDGDLYVTWAETTTDGTVPGGSAIRIARSDDKGATWRTQTFAVVPYLAFMPTVAVAGDGTVGITWYDTRNDSVGDTALTTDVWFAASSDEGTTWREVHLAGAFDLRQAPRDVFGTRLFLGDYAGLVGFPDGFGALFPLAPPLAEHGASDAFFARVRLPGHDVEPAKVTGSGGIPAEDGHSVASFDLAVHGDDDGTVKGHLVVHDPAADVEIEAVTFHGIVVRETDNGWHCSITGQARVTRDETSRVETFEVGCEDRGTARDRDGLRIDTPSYSAGGHLISGNVKVHG